MQLSLTPQRVIGGATFKLTITVDQISSCSTGIALATDNSLLELPSQIVLPPNEKTATVPIKTGEVPATDFATLSVSCGDCFQSATIFLDPPTGK